MKKILLCSIILLSINASYAQCFPAPAGMIGWWPGDGNTFDIINCNHGTLQNGASYAPGEVANSFSFDGVNDYVKIPQAPYYDVGNAVTIDFWMKADPDNPMSTCCQGLVTTGYYNVEISGGNDPVIGVNFSIATTTEGGGISIAHTSDANGGGAPISHDWHHVAGTYDGTKLQLYIDGQPLGNPTFHTGTIAPMPPNGFLAIGSEDGLTFCPSCIGTRYFKGLIDEVEIFNRALTPAEILAIYNAGSAGKCKATFYQDADGDGYGNPLNSIQDCSAPSGYVTDSTDCNDADTAEHPGQTWYIDADGDDHGSGAPLIQCTRPTNGYVASELTATSGDCNDNNAAVNPGADEACNTIDDDCDGETDEDFDNDNDTYTTCEGDCNDADTTEHPGQTWYIDNDGDDYASDDDPIVQCTRPTNGYVASELTATSGDCNDNNAAVNPGADEACNTIDDDCDGETDEGFDNDNDTYTTCEGDCNDADTTEHPGQTWYIDNDGDDYASDEDPIVQCTRPANGYVPSELTAASGDCNDNNAAVNPGETEVCNTIDDDCDGETDEDNVCGSPVQISIADKSVQEGNSGTKTMKFKVTLSQASQQKVKVNYTTVNGTAKAPGDYVAQSGTLTIAAGKTQKNIKITIKGDTKLEADETFNVTLSNPVNATIADDSATGTILNDDGAALAESITWKTGSNADRSVKVTPNPATSMLYVQLSGYTGNVIIQLHNSEGEVIKQQKIQSAFVKYELQQINVADLNSGVYFLVVIDEKRNRQTEKIIVTR